MMLDNFLEDLYYMQEEIKFVVDEYGDFDLGPFDDLKTVTLNDIYERLEQIRLNQEVYTTLSEANEGPF
jgi:hypothetical protein